ncbi:MAG: hypothetical protein HOH61_24405 [Rhodospirillaceae bacterium]|nr:hypothetical protein [Rhodospirillaceae bacterium]MBT5899061.1 hypothetical protein [Rhodospirillaceae bacterium]
MDFAEEARQLLEQSGYELRINPFMSQWATAAAEFPGKKVLNPEFDPKLINLNPANSFWLELNCGETIASFAMRDLGAENLCDLISTYALWGGGPGPLQVENRDRLPTGNLTLEGACWIHPAHRGLGLPWLLPRIARALALQRTWAPSSFVGNIVNRPLADGKQLALEKYGCQRLFKIADNFCYPFLPVQPLYLTVSDRDYVIDQLSNSARCLRQYADQKVGRDFVAFIREGQKQPTKTRRRAVGGMFDTLVGGAAEIGGRRPINDHGFTKNRVVKIGR